MNIVSRPWELQDLLDDLQMYITEEPDNYLNGRRTAMCMARDFLKEYFEREQGCEVCSHGKYLTAIFTDQNGADRLMLFKFCPNCGRKMPEE